MRRIWPTPPDPVLALDCILFALALIAYAVAVLWGLA
jgi:hypothetical protein